MTITQISLWVIVALTLIFIANKYGGKKNNSLHALAKEGKCERLEEVLRNNAQVDKQNKHGMTPLHVAVLYNHVACVELLLGAAANANLAGEEGDTPLHSAVDTSKEMVELLLKHKAKVTTKNDYGSTALQDAVARPDNLEIVKLLLAHGAKLDDTNKYGNTLLHEATLNEGTLDTVKFLVDQGLDMHAKNADGQTPLEFALENENYEVVDYLDALDLS
ncbi:MAG: hypothetical protein GQ531_04275 [Sulfurovum sp.]|nr:hypothetical protein [Sulfurovum sp.]